MPISLFKIKNNSIKDEKENNLEDNNNNNIIDEKQIKEIEQKDTTIRIKHNYKSGNYQYINNNNCSSSNKSKDKETKSKQTKYLVANNEVLNHLIYFTNSSNKTGLLPGTSSKTKSDPEFQ